MGAVSGWAFGRRAAAAQAGVRHLPQKENTVEELGILLRELLATPAG